MHARTEAVIDVVQNHHTTCGRIKQKSTSKLSFLQLNHNGCWANLYRIDILWRDLRWTVAHTHARTRARTHERTHTHTNTQTHKHTPMFCYAFLSSIYQLKIAKFNTPWNELVNANILPHRCILENNSRWYITSHFLSRGQNGRTMSTP